MTKYPLMFCFVGEQPVSNYIPIEFLKPAEVILYVSNLTEKIGNTLINVIDVKKSINEIDPYSITEMINKLSREIKERKEIDNNKVVFNLTGGTKPMVFAGFFICQKYNCPFCYLQSEGGKSILYTYHWQDSEPLLLNREELPVSFDLDKYIKLHVGEYHIKNKTKKYENLIYYCLKDNVDEIIKNVYLTNALEIDLIFRVGNQVGIAEIKTKKRATKKEGIDQLNTAGGREYLGTYTKKFYIADREYPENNKALARDRNITVIELINSENTDELLTLDERDQIFLVDTILSEMRK